MKNYGEKEKKSGLGLAGVGGKRVRIFLLVKDQSPIYHQIWSLKLDYANQFEFD